jgi:methionyl-tRNA synthetase
MFSTSLPEFVMIAQKLGISVTSLVCLLVVVALWTIVWKGWALWTAARRHEKKWFVVLLVVNTLGILEIIYLFFLNKRKK